MAHVTQSEIVAVEVGARFAFQSLDVYVAAPELAALVHAARLGESELRDQATRAAKSVFLNLCEGLPSDPRRDHRLKQGDARWRAAPRSSTEPDTPGPLPRQGEGGTFEPDRDPDRSLTRAGIERWPAQPPTWAT